MDYLIANAKLQKAPGRTAEPIVENTSRLSRYGRGDGLWILRAASTALR
jgi:hypothetical protein